MARAPKPPKDARKQTTRISTAGMKMSTAEKRKAKTRQAKEAQRKSGYGKGKVTQAVKKVVNRVKQTLPRTDVIEHAEDFRNRQNRRQSRAEYVADRDQIVAKHKAGKLTSSVSASGKKYTPQSARPRIEEKKGWGKNAPVRRRVMKEK